VKEKAEFRSISVKADLIEEVERVMKESGRYRSLAEFFSEAARLKLESLEANKA
jgi:metal-responsive CopG/Arc/MetJ family transcriptional regulator